MKKASYILLLTGIVIMFAGLLIFNRINIGAVLVSGFVGSVLLISSIAINISNRNKKEQKRLAYVRAK